MGRYQFTVVMPNLNCDVAQDVAQDVVQDVAQCDHQGDYQENEIKKMMKKNENITVKEIAVKLNVSPETIRRRIKKMPNVKYVGSGYSGHWEVEE